MNTLTLHDVGLVFVGGGLGSVLRFLLVKAVQATPAEVGHFPFPKGTLLVNALGSFAIGLLAAFGLERASLTHEMRLLAIVGILGGFTTFSSLVYETLELARLRTLALAAVYAFGSFGLGLLGAWMGRALGAVARAG